MYGLNDRPTSWVVDDDKSIRWVLDKALQSTYSLKGFSLDAENYEGKQPPIMGDLMNVLEGMEGGDRLALRLSKYVSGTFGKVFNNYTNIDINN